MSRSRGNDWPVYRRALIVGGGGLAAAVVLAAAGHAAPPGPALAKMPVIPSVRAIAPVKKLAPARIPAALTPALRKKGFHECNPHDPLGLGPYAPYRKLSMGRIAIPQKGGHTADMGFDVVVHFHGYSAVRKTLVQTAGGVAYVGIDRGIGSGPYSKAFKKRDVFPLLIRSIEGALKKHTHDEGAHIRHLALSAWSAGYGAINEILKQGDARVDAVVLLDGLHAAWNPASPKRDGSLRSLSSQPLAPTFHFARRALSGEKVFIFTHSTVDPEKYPSTEATANLLLHELGARRTAKNPGQDPFGQTGTVDQRGFHVWSYRGGRENAHCDHIRHIARAVRLLEQKWRTPEMDRNVPPTAAPKLGGGAKMAETSPGVQLELVPETANGAQAADEAANASTPPAGREVTGVSKEQQTADSVPAQAGALTPPAAVENVAADLASPSPEG